MIRKRGAADAPDEVESDAGGGKEEEVEVEEVLTFRKARSDISSLFLSLDKFN